MGSMKIYGGFATGVHRGFSAKAPVTLASKSITTAAAELIRDLEVQGWSQVEVHLVEVTDEAYFADDRWKTRR